jgi:hypothetical protein
MNIMKKLFLFAACLCFFSCEEKAEDPYVDASRIHNPDIVACGVKNPQKNLPWLNELIKQADKDIAGQDTGHMPGHYLGIIWLVKYKEKDFFVTSMKFGSGGVMYWILNCSGSHYAGEGTSCVADEYVGSHHFSLEEGDMPPLHELKLDSSNMVYSNIPF